MSANPETVTALCEALDDEYRAVATYSAVIEAFGPVRPFVNIIEAERRHAAALLQQFDRLGLAPPPDAWQGRVSAPSSLLDACQAGIKAEIENDDMYRRLLSGIADPQVAEVMRRLQQASQKNHLPAFRRCAQRLSGSAGEDGGRPSAGRHRRRFHSGSGNNR